MKAHAKEAFEILAVAFPRWEAGFEKPERCEVWGSLVADIPRDRLIPAVRLLARTSKFPPSIAEICEASGAPVPRSVIYAEDFE
jgi:hypothetical protein